MCISAYITCSLCAPSIVSELEYFQFMLVAMKKVDAQLFDDLHQQFCLLDSTGDGKVNFHSIVSVLIRTVEFNSLRSFALIVPSDNEAGFEDNDVKKDQKGVSQVAIE